jgi:hypothetical protein
MKQLVYVTPINTIEEPRVQNAAQEIRQNRGILDLVRLSWARRTVGKITEKLSQKSKKSKYFIAN